MSRPLSLSVKMATYLFKQKVRKVDKFAMTLFIEPLELCNLECEGCGRIREYADVMHMKLSVDDCLRVANEVDAPIVTIPGGEPLIHPEIDQIVGGLVDQGRFVYMCTNGILLEKKLPKFTPSDQFCVVVHMDGMREQHDKAVCRPGVWDKAVKAMRQASAEGFRVCTNTTIYKESDPDDTAKLFQFLTDDVGVEGCIVAPGYDYEAAEIGLAPGRTMDDVFLPREEAQRMFREVRQRSGRCISNSSKASATTNAQPGPARRIPSAAGARHVICWRTTTSPVGPNCCTKPIGRPMASAAIRAAPTV